MEFHSPLVKTENNKPHLKLAPARNQPRTEIWAFEESGEKRVDQDTLGRQGHEFAHILLDKGKSLKFLSNIYLEGTKIINHNPC